MSVQKMFMMDDRLIGDPPPFGEQLRTLALQFGFHVDVRPRPALWKNEPTIEAKTAAFLAAWQAIAEWAGPNNVPIEAVLIDDFDSNLGQRARMIFQVAESVNVNVAMTFVPDWRPEFALLTPIVHRGNFQAARFHDQGANDDTRLAFRAGVLAGTARGMGLPFYVTVSPFSYGASGPKDDDPTLSIFQTWIDWIIAEVDPGALSLWTGDLGRGGQFDPPISDQDVEDRLIAAGQIIHTATSAT